MIYLEKCISYRSEDVRLKNKHIVTLNFKVQI